MLTLQDVIDPVLVHRIGSGTVLGVDIGSRSAKAVLLHDGQVFLAQIPTGVNMQTTAEELLEELLDSAAITQDDIDYAVGTGYGRISLRFETVPTEIVTEISCHAMGAHYLNAATRTIIDIGGQDSKAIQIDPDTGKVAKFIMNDKCAAGTGRFLEKAAALLDYTVKQVGPPPCRPDRCRRSAVSARCSRSRKSSRCGRVACRERTSPPASISPRRNGCATSSAR